MSGAVDALAPSATKVRIWPTRWISLPPSSDPTTIPTQKPAPTAPTAVGENPSSVPRTLSSVACNALPVSMRPKPKSRANRPAIVAYSVAGIDALHDRTDYLLKDLLFDDAGHRMIATHATKAGVRYRYYVSQPALHGQTRTAKHGSVLRVP